ncbi:MAG: DUF4160 domain-containing protein [Phycisphaeraceae bacterium]|nr:DUF4160 domain-containing protein [Phycisphaeraceae bacterium]
MPTVLEIDGFRFFFWSNENDEPPHIHVEKGRGVAKWWIDPPREAWSKGLKAGEKRKVARLVEEHAGLFREAWDAFFGE